MRKSEAKQSYIKTNMSDGKEASNDEQHLIKEIGKQINKIKYFLEEIEEMIEIHDYTEMEIVNKQKAVGSCETSKDCRHICIG